jgi:hypothetical protein
MTWLTYTGGTALPPSTIRHIVEAVEPLEYDRIYGAWWGKVVPDGRHRTVGNTATNGGVR